MRNLTFLLLIPVLIWTSACGSSDQESGSVTGVSPNTPTGYGEFNISPVPGTSLEKAQKLDANGNLVEQGLLKDGKRNGTWIKYYDNSTLPAVISSYIDDKYNGPYMEFDRSQQLTLQAFYQDNLLDGYWAKYASGELTNEATYTSGKLNGVYKEYRSNAKVAKEIHYKDGQLDGPYRFFDDAGSTVLEYTYKNGQKQ